MSDTDITTDHARIRDWVEARGGTPARVKDSGKGGILRIDFGASDDGLEPIGWDRFFEIFEDRNLAFLHQHATASGDTSRFNKLIDRDSDDDAETPDAGDSRVITDHHAIRDWIEARNGRPARVAGTGDGGILRIDFGVPDDDLEPIGWDLFFEIFEDRKLGLLHQDRTASGKISRFSRFVDRS